MTEGRWSRVRLLFFLSLNILDFKRIMSTVACIRNRWFRHVPSNETRLSAGILKHFESTKVEHVMSSAFKQIRPFTTSLNLRVPPAARLRDTEALGVNRAEHPAK